MNKYDLSILIPSRNEMFLAKTVESVLKAIKGKTEIIVALDGAWADPAIPDDPRVTLIYFPEARGQRGATNACCRLSTAKYVMKMDAHCTVDEGFDVKLMADMQDDWTVIPAMYNLHAFDWICIGKLEPVKPYNEEDRAASGCGYKFYQGPTPPNCEKCGGNMERRLFWQHRLSKLSHFYRFDKELHFQYWGAYRERPEAQGNIVPIFSAQGSCFMLTREKYWEREISDESLAGKTGWGQQGVEVACKTWLSGGQLMVNKNTWYSHMFRTQGGDFSFPFRLSGNEVKETREKSRQLFQQDNWPKAKHTFNWLIKKFRPPDWEDVWMGDPSGATDYTKGTRRGIIYYTDNQLKLKYAHMVQKQLKSVGVPIVSASLKPMEHFGKNVHIKKERGLEAYFSQIISALEASDADIVYMCEHDVLYHPSHFDFIPPTQDKFYYNQNFWRIRPEKDNFAVHFDANQVSGLVCYRRLLLDWYKKKWEKIQKEGFDRSYEPGGRDSNVQVAWKSTYPNIDIRHGGNLTKSKWSLADFRDKSTAKGWEESTIDKIPGWNNLAERFGV